MAENEVAAPNISANDLEIFEDEIIDGESQSTYLLLVLAFVSYRATGSHHLS